jgi:transposase
MIATDKRKAVFLLHQEGMEARAIARRLDLSRNTVRAIIRQEGATPQPVRADKLRLDEELLRRLYQECQGRMARVHEKLVEEEGVQVTYPTLTRRLRELGISNPPKPRCDRVPDEPGLEMQHDTSLYHIELGGRRVKLLASLIYLRYCKRRYLRFYRAFDRFKMKCFFHEALMFWGYAARQCIIDNTNLARLRGVGSRAIITPEMEAFAKQYGFIFRCHALDHPNRKAGEERSFWTVETNFLPGRTFASLEDINQQALAWSTVRMDHKPQGKAGLIPAQAFEFECGHLTALPAHLPAPYKLHDRGTDQYGYLAFGGNYYWVPGTRRDEVKVLEYSDRLKLFQARECVAEYPLPADGVRNAKFSPQGLPTPIHHPKNRRHPTDVEEKHLRALGPPVKAYLEFALPEKGIARHHLIRQLLALSRKLSADLFLKSLERALKYRITSLEVIERIAFLYLQQGAAELPPAQVDEAFRQREAYLEGSLTEPPDLSLYQDPPEPPPPPNHE